MSNLLTAESPLILLPSLASEFGIAEAIILQQIHYISQQDGKGLIHDGHKWIYNTLEDWHTKLSCWSMATVERAITKLKKLGIILVDRLGKHKSNRTNYYRIDYPKLAHIPQISSPAKCENDSRKMQECSTQNEGMDSRKMMETMTAKCGNGYPKHRDWLSAILLRTGLRDGIDYQHGRNHSTGDADTHLSISAVQAVLVSINTDLSWKYHNQLSDLINRGFSNDPKNHTSRSTVPVAPTHPSREFQPPIGRSGHKPHRNKPR